MIDGARLPAQVLLDTGVLIRALGQRTQEPKALACIELWDALIAKSRDIYIAAPSIAEMLRFGLPLNVPLVRQVRVVAFDRVAAEECAKYFKYSDFQNASANSGLPVTYYKYDALISACALRAKVKAIVSLDDKLATRVANAGIPLDIYRPDFFQVQGQPSSPSAVPTPPTAAAQPAAGVSALSKT